MPSIYDSKPSEIIAKAAEALKNDIKIPDWAHFVKTSPANQRHPASKDWYFFRAASVLLKVYKRGPIGTSKLRTLYSKKKDRGYKREHTYRASGKILRTILQQLEKAAYLEQATKAGHKGRIITKKGRALFTSLLKPAK